MACISPIRKTDKKYGVLWLDCGRCVKCVIKRRSDWTFRLLQEHQDAKSSYFVTLTYNEKNLLYADYPTLDYNDLQKYFKRLRKNNTEKIKYYAVGEYGEKNFRPHYHAIIFNAKKSTISEAWSLQEKAFGERKSIGIVHVGNVTQESIHYVTKYIHKNKDKTPPGSEVQKALMSKHLGYGYINRAKLYHERTKNTFITYPGGYKATLPRYYARKIWSDNDRKVIYRNQHQKRERERDQDSGRKAWIDSIGTDLEKATFPIYDFNKKELDKEEWEKIRYLEHIIDQKAKSHKV